MLTVNTNEVTKTCDNVSRRSFLRAGALTVAGLTLSDLMRLRAQGRASNNKAIVWLWLNGGATHIETFDPKMGAPSEFRSVTGAIRTSVPGIEIGGGFPRMASLADKMVFVRSFSHNNSGHGGGSHWVNTGYDFQGADQNLPQIKPSVGSIVSRHRGASNHRGLPNYVTFRTNPAFGPAWLGGQYTPFEVQGDARANMELRLPADRMTDRRSLLQAFDSMNREVDRTGLLNGMDAFEMQAFNLMQSRASDVFDLSREPASLIESYGGSRQFGTQSLGRQMLMARRLVEAGVSFVTLESGNWDMHTDIERGLSYNSPILDNAVSGFINDIYQRGMQNDVLLVITGEFGRTPRINSGAGRDHWSQLSTLAMSGGGLHMGQVIGQSSSKAEYPVAGRVTPQDLMSTIFSVLDIPQDLTYNDQSGRPVYMIDGGRPIGGLV